MVEREKDAGSKVLAICLIAKNEARYLPEWLEYHFMIGVDQIFIYDNGSDDDIARICAMYGASVVLIDWPGRESPQKLAYQHYIRNHGKNHKWTAFIDADEFIYWKREASLTSALAELSDFAGIELPWIIFDTNNHDVPPEGLILENYTRAHRVAPQRNVKTICQTHLVDFEKISSPHVFPYHGDARPYSGDVEKFAICHYMIRSRAEVWAKVRRGDAWSVETERKRLANVERAVKSILDKYDNADVVETRMLQYVQELKLRLARRYDASDLIGKHCSNF